MKSVRSSIAWLRSNKASLLALASGVVLASGFIYGLRILIPRVADAIMEPVPPPQPSAESGDKKEEEEELRRHRAAIRRCVDEGNQPVMGFGFAIVCIKRDGVAWTREGKFK
jgi:hypothetical protein